MKKNSAPLKTFPFKKNFQFPETFFNQLQEFTSGGYVLIYLNSFGNPQALSNFDTSASSIALTTFGKEYFDTKNNIQKQIIREAVGARVGLETQELADEGDEEEFS